MLKNGVTARKKMAFCLQLLIFIFLLTLNACSKTGNVQTISDSSTSTTNSASTTNVNVTWQATPTRTVNSSGGGYLVYHSQTAGFDIASATVVNVPYVTGSTAPTSTVISLADGTWYFKVVAYAAIDNATVYSAPTNEISLTVARRQ